MKRVLFLSLLLIFTFGSLNAADIEDTSILDELEKGKIKQLDFDFKLKTFESCDNLEDIMGNYIKDYWENNKDIYRGGPIYYLDDVMMKTNSIADFADSDGIMEESVAQSTGGNGEDYSETNVQVQGVDESDIVKTDGTYIYYYNESDKYVYIVKSDGLEIIKKIKIPSNFNSPVLYLGENRLTIISSGYSNVDYSKRGYRINRNSKTYTIVFDTSDINNPSLIKLYIADGNLRKSRKIGDYLYIISNNSFNIPYYDFKKAGDIRINVNSIIPKAIELTKTSDVSKQNLEIKERKLPYNLKAGNIANCNEIEYVLPDSETMSEYGFSPSYNIISIINTGDIEEDIKTKVIAGDNAEIYMSLDNLYLTSNIYKTYNYSCPANARCFAPWYPRGQNTLVHKVNIDGNELAYQDSTIIPGAPLTQYSMDEYETNFRILTKTNNWTGNNQERHTDLYILDEDLDLKGSLTNLGSGEDFKSSRYIGDKLFLVTFKQIDPLFAIDLSDPSNPEVLGELKIPGYSTYLHLYDDNHLIGLGYDTKENQWGGTINNGVKIDLYEINYDKKCGDSDLSQDEIDKCESGDYKGIIVKQLHSLTLGEYGSYSEALNNPRMFMWKTADNKLFLPVTLYVNDSDDQYKHIDFFQGLSIIDIDKSTGIKENFRLTHMDTSIAESERDKECSKYTSDTTEEKCVELIGGGEYCQAVKYKYVPEYCYADSTIGEYISSRNWNYRNSFIKRALWIGDNTYAISDDQISSSNIDTGNSIDSAQLK